MPNCPTCGKQLEAGVRFCPDDGTPLTDTAALGSHHTPSISVEDPTLRIGSILGDRYRLVGHLGGGGMAHVYRAHDNRLGRDVAVKIMAPQLRSQPEFDARFRRKAQVVSRLSDPHIVVMHDFGLDPGHGPYLVMELLEGQSLRHRLNRGGALPLPQALQLGSQLMLALMHAHEAGVIHRDLKPDNVFLLDHSGMRLHVRILDFGVSRILGPHGGFENLTNSGAMIGTPRYMPPEQTTGQPADERSDLYSAALVIYEALTGQLPDSIGLQLRKKCPEAPVELEMLLEQCLRSDPDERPVSATEAFLQLHQLAQAMGALTVSHSAMKQMTARFQSLKSADVQPVEQPAVKRAFPVRRALLAGGIVLLLACLAWWMVQPGRRPSSRESLAGISIADPRDGVAVAVGKPPLSSSLIDPWESDGSLLLPLLRPQDIGLSLNELKQLRIMKWLQPTVVAIIHDDRVIAVLARGGAAATSKGIGIGTAESDLRHAYASDSPEVVRFDTPPRNGSTMTWGLVYRYSELGLAFEVYDGKVTGVGMFPAEQRRPP